MATSCASLTPAQCLLVGAAAPNQAAAADGEARSARSPRSACRAELRR
jgi:hypothetical protein